MFYIEESQDSGYSELQKLKKIQKLCQKRALEVNRLATSQMSQSPINHEPETNNEFVFNPEVALDIYTIYN